MKILLTLITISLLSLTSIAKAEKGYTALFDGKSLEGWTAAKGESDRDWANFSVNKKEKAIHTYAGEKANSTQVSDCLLTKAQFSHYILKLEYKWPGKRFAPRADWDRDAGLLFHVHGDRKKIWPFCYEMQIGESAGDKDPAKKRYHSGDLFVLGNHLRAKTSRNGAYYDPNGKTVTGRNLMTKLGKEKPKGQWNEMEIRIDGADKATFILNGEIVLELFELEQKNKEGTYVPISKGYIGLQAEWAEILYRNIRIKETKPN